MTMMVLFGVPLRRTTGFVECLLRLIGLEWNVLDFRRSAAARRPLQPTSPTRARAEEAVAMAEAETPSFFPGAPFVSVTCGFEQRGQRLGISDK